MREPSRCKPAPRPLGPALHDSVLPQSACSGPPDTQGAIRPSSTFCPPPPPPLLPHTAPSCLAGHPPPHPGMAPSGPVSGWSVDDVAAWLTGDLSLPPAAADAFKENAVAGGGARPQRFQSQLDAPSL